MTRDAASIFCDAGILVALALSESGLRESLAAFFSSDLDLFCAETGGGCFMLATALPLAGADPEIADRIQSGLAGLRTAVVERLKRAQLQGEVAAQMPIETAADLFLSTHIALANRARSGETREVLNETTQRVVDLICAV